MRLSTSKATADAEQLMNRYDRHLFSVSPAGSFPDVLPDASPVCSTGDDGTRLVIFAHHLGQLVIPGG